MVVPDRVVQAERLVAVAPAVAGAVVLLDDDRRHAELPQPCAERDATLTTTDDQRVGLAGVAQFAGLRLALLLPARPVLRSTMLRTERPGEAKRLLETLEFDERGQQRPDPAVAQPDQPVAAPDPGLEADPGGGHTPLFRRDLALGDAPARRCRALELMAQHVGDLGAALHGLDVPGEGDEVAPVAVLREHLRGAVDVPGLEGRTERIQKLGDLIACRCVEHVFSSRLFFVR